MSIQAVEYVYAKALKILRGKALKRSWIDRSSFVGSGSTLVDVSMGRLSFCGYDCTFLDVEIGAFCSIASRVIIGGVDHPMHFVSTSPAFLSHRDSIVTRYARHNFLPKVRTYIGSDVWIGDCSIIKAGVSIGHGAVVGMGAVVTKNVEPYAVVAGNPARVLKYRFAPEIVESLLASKWWTLSHEDLVRLGPLFNRPEQFLEAIKADRPERAL